MRIYVDESNIKLTNKDINEIFIVCSGAFIHDDFLVEKVEKFKQRFEIDEIKGSDLFTKANTHLRKWVVQELLNYASGTFTIWNFYLQKSLDITYEWCQNSPKHLITRTAERFLLSSNMAEHCRGKLFILNNKNWRNNFDEKQFFYNVKNSIIKNERHIPGFKNAAKIFMMEIEDIIPEGWHKKINNDDYQVLQTLLMDVLENFGESLEFELDQIPHEEPKQTITKLLKHKSPTSKITFQDSKQSIGIQIADWVASITRKAVHELLTRWMYRKFEVGDFISDEEIEFGNELLVIWKTINKVPKNTFHIQLTYRERSFLECIKSLSNITDIIDEKFEGELNKEEQNQIFHDFQTMIDTMP